MSTFRYKCHVNKNRIQQAIENHDCYDSWGEAEYGNNRQAVEYNICIDNSTEKQNTLVLFTEYLKVRTGAGNMTAARNGIPMRLIFG